MSRKTIICMAAFLAAGFVFGSLIPFSKILNEIKRLGPSYYKTQRYNSRVAVHEYLGNSKDDILIIGDSLTEYFEWFEYFKGKPIKNRGIGSDVIVGVINRLSTIQTAEKIICMIGINDILQGKDNEKIVNEYKELLSGLKKIQNGKKIFVVSILPVGGRYSKLNSTIIDINKRLYGLTNSEDVTFLDLHGLLLDKSEKLDEKYSVDGIHLNGNGYKILCNGLSAQINLMN